MTLDDAVYFEGVMDVLHAYRNILCYNLQYCWDHSCTIFCFITHLDQEHFHNQGYRNKYIFKYVSEQMKEACLRKSLNKQLMCWRKEDKITVKGLIYTLVVGLWAFLLYCDATLVKQTVLSFAPVGPNMLIIYLHST